MLLIGCGGGRRAALLRAALERRGGRLRVIEWRALLEAGALPADLGSGHRWCKIDPPGEEPALDDLLIGEGRLAIGAGPPAAPLRHGELAWRHHWFAGFRRRLAGLQSELAARAPGVRLLNSVEEIIGMGDKLACQRRLAAHGVAVPALLGEVSGFEAFEAQFPAREHPRVFIKARYGSSGAGVVALQRHPDGRLAAISPTRVAPDGALFNHLRLARLTERRAIAALVDRLAAQGAYAEAWVPKPRAPLARGAGHDLRVVTFAGAARQRIARIAGAPLTNLHLGSRRAAPEWLSAPERDLLEETAAHAAGAFPASLSIGFDLILRGRRAVVLEANAFGDLLPDLRHDGATTYDDQAARVVQDEC